MDTSTSSFRKPPIHTFLCQLHEYDSKIGQRLRLLGTVVGILHDDIQQRNDRKNHRSHPILFLDDGTGTIAQVVAQPHMIPAIQAHVGMILDCIVVVVGGEAARVVGPNNSNDSRSNCVLSSCFSSSKQLEAEMLAPVKDPNRLYQRWHQLVVANNNHTTTRTIQRTIMNEPQREPNADDLLDIIKRNPQHELSISEWAIWVNRDVQQVRIWIQELQLRAQVYQDAQGNILPL